MVPQHLGQTVINGTTYQVYNLGVLENARKAGIVANFALEGPRGAKFFVTDHGPKYQLNSVAVGGGRSWQCAARPLRGLKREHLSLFYEAVNA
jgi:hypothetical protein